MRRVVANFVLLVMLGTLFAPALTWAAPQPIPACCRRNGAHHCAMMATEVSVEGKAFGCSNPCPMRQAPQLGCSVVALPASRVASAALHRELLIGSTHSRHFSSPRQHNLSRGPPRPVVP